MTLVELMVAMVISMVLLAGVYQIFVGSTNSNRENEQFSRLQENARFAMEVIGRDLRMAGYAGCAGPSVATNNRLTGVTGPIVAVEGDVGGINELTLRGMLGNDFYPVDPLTPPTATAITLVDGSRLNLGDVVMLSDCRRSDISQITAKNSADEIVLDAADVFTDFPEGYVDGTAEVVPYQTVVYSVALGELTRNAQPIIEGVQRMSIRYGVDTDGDGDVDAYVTAGPPAPNWNEVVAVRVSLLLQSDIIPKAAPDNAAYDMNGDGDTADAEDFPADGAQRLRRVFKATYGIRSRLP